MFVFHKIIFVLEKLPPFPYISLFLSFEIALLILNLPVFVHLIRQLVCGGKCFSFSSEFSFFGGGGSPKKFSRESDVFFYFSPFFFFNVVFLHICLMNLSVYLGNIGV